MLASRINTVQASVATKADSSTAADNIIRKGFKYLKPFFAPPAGQLSNLIMDDLINFANLPE